MIWDVRRGGGFKESPDESNAAPKDGGDQDFLQPGHRLKLHTIDFLLIRDYAFNIHLLVVIHDQNASVNFTKLSVE